MNVKRLKTFQLLAEYKNFSTVAQMLQISQPAVTKQLQTLEKELGVALLNRANLELTEAGRFVLSRTVKLIAEWNELVEACKKYQGDLSGVLQIGASTIPGTYLLPKLIKRMLEAFPQIEVKISVHESNEVLDLLREEKIDIGFVGSEPPKSVFISQLFAEDVLVIIGPPGSENVEDFSDLKHKPFIFRSKQSGTWQAAQASLSKLGYSIEDLSCTARVKSTESVLAMVEAGMGYSFVSHFAANIAAQTGRVVPLLELPVKRSFYMTYQHSKHHNPLVQSLISMLD